MLRGNHGLGWMIVAWLALVALIAVGIFVVAALGGVQLLHL